MSRLTNFRIAAFLIGGLSIAATLLVFFPAGWVGAILESQTEGRWMLGDVEGTFWRGSALVGHVPKGQTSAYGFLPGRLFWQVSPLGVLGRVEVRLDNPDVLAHSLRIKGTWSHWQLEGAQVRIPAEQLVNFGAPFNTIQPAGQMTLSWSALDLRKIPDALEIHGSTVLEIRGLSSRLSSVRPLGSYQWTANWNGKEAQCVLKTLAGPMQLSGVGRWANQHMTFSGQAQSDEGSEKQLENLLNLLGKSSKENGKNIVTLEWK